MQTGLIILIVALVVVAVAGPALGYYLARQRFERRQMERSASDQRIRELESELRRLRAPNPGGSGAVDIELSRIRAELAEKDRQIDALRRSARTLADHTAAPAPPASPAPLSPPIPADAAPATLQTSARKPRPPAVSGVRRFDLEPPLFGPETGSPAGPEAAPPTGEPARRGASTAPSEPPKPRSTGLPALSVTVPSTATVPPGKMPAPSAETSAAPTKGMQQPRGDSSPAAPLNPSGKPESAAAKSPAHASGRESGQASGTSAGKPPTFTPVSALIKADEAAELAWLPDVSAGRRLKLRQLGYDDPVKLGSLKVAEIRRLARAVDVTEDEIRTIWMPLARKRSGSAD